MALLIYVLMDSMESDSVGIIVDLILCLFLILPLTGPTPSRWSHFYWGAVGGPDYNSFLPLIGPTRWSHFYWCAVGGPDYTFLSLDQHGGPTFTVVQ